MLEFFRVQVRVCSPGAYAMKDEQERKIPIELHLLHCMILLDPVTMRFDEVSAFFHFFKLTGITMF